jgi:hypothetical protein
VLYFIVDKGPSDPDRTHILNLTSTFSSLLGLSIPYSNTGSIIPQTYIFDNQEYCTSFYKNLALKYKNNLNQLLDYKENYFDSHTLAGNSTTNKYI